MERSTGPHNPRKLEPYK